MNLRQKKNDFATQPAVEKNGFLAFAWLSIFFHTFLCLSPSQVSHFIFPFSFSLSPETEETAGWAEEVSKADQRRPGKRQIACQKVIAGRKKRVSRDILASSFPFSLVARLLPLATVPKKRNDQVCKKKLREKNPEFILSSILQPGQVAASKEKISRRIAGENWWTAWQPWETCSWFGIRPSWKAGRKNGRTNGCSQERKEKKRTKNDQIFHFTE